jgi:hypothetical protein
MLFSILLILAIFLSILVLIGVLRHLHTNSYGWFVDWIILPILFGITGLAIGRGIGLLVDLIDKLIS